MNSPPYRRDEGSIEYLHLPGGRNALWIIVPREDLPDRSKWGRTVHIARTAISGCQTECGITLKKGWRCTNEPFDKDIVCTECWETINHLNRIRGMG